VLDCFQTTTRTIFHVEIPFCQENSISLREIEADTPPSNTAVEYRLKEFHGSHVKHSF